MNLLGRCAWGWLVLALCMAGCGDDKPATDVPPEANRADSPMISLEEPVMQAFGPLDGPYMFIEAQSPTRVIFIRMADGTNHQFELAGLLDDEYRPPAPPKTADAATTATAPVEAAASAPAESPEILAARERLRRFKQDALKEMLDKDPVWVVRLARDEPTPVYIFRPLKPPTARGEAPRGFAYLVNALVLNKGIANMDLGDSEHVFYEQMLTSQLAAIARSERARKNKKPLPDIWSQFEMRMPMAPYQARITQLETLVD